MMHIAVNGTLMRGLELNQNLLAAGAVFVREDLTASCYRWWSIDNRYPGMLRTNQGNGAAIELEIWEVDEIGRVLLAKGDEVLRILAEPYLVEGMLEITNYRGWRDYIKMGKRTNISLGKPAGLCSKGNVI